MTAFLGVALLGVLAGIAVAVALSILECVPARVVAIPDHARSRPGDGGLPRPPVAPDAEKLPGLVIFRFDAPLFFANARTFRDQIRRLAAAEPPTAVDPDRGRADHRCRHDRGRHARDLDEELNAAGTSLAFAKLKDPVREKLERYQLIGPLDPRHFFPTLDAALDAFRQQTGGEWTSTTDTSA